MKMRLFTSALIGIGLSVTSAPLFSAVLLEVDVSNPAAVTITATSNASQIDDSTAELGDGVDLEGFLTAPTDPPADTFIVTGNLTPPNWQDYSYGAWWIDVDRGANPSLNFFYQGVNYSDLQEFTTAAPAFTGVATADLSAYASILPRAGATGDITAGFSIYGSGDVIGQWVAVPEPSMAALAAIGAVVFMGRRVRQHRLA